MNTEFVLSPQALCEANLPPRPGSFFILGKSAPSYDFATVPRPITFLAEDRDAYQTESVKGRFSKGALRHATYGATGLWIVVFAARKAGNDQRNGSTSHCVAHEKMAQRFLEAKVARTLVKTTHDRVGFWLQTVREHGGMTPVHVIDGTGAWTVNQGRLI